jgi:hypothetical protein
MFNRYTKKALKELDALIGESKAYSRLIGAENRRAMRLIMNLLRPWWKSLCAGTLLKFIVSAARLSRLLERQQKCCVRRGAR